MIPAIKEYNKEREILKKVENKYKKRTRLFGKEKTDVLPQR